MYCLKTSDCFRLLFSNSSPNNRLFIPSSRRKYKWFSRFVETYSRILLIKLIIHIVINYSELFRASNPKFSMFKLHRCEVYSRSVLLVFYLRFQFFMAEKFCTSFLRKFVSPTIFRADSNKFSMFKFRWLLNFNSHNFQSYLTTFLLYEFES